MRNRVEITAEHVKLKAGFPIDGNCLPVRIEYIAYKIAEAIGAVRGYPVSNLMKKELLHPGTRNHKTHWDLYVTTVFKDKVTEVIGGGHRYSR